MANRLNKEHYYNIQRKFEEETGVRLTQRAGFSKRTVTARAAIAVCICLTLAGTSVFAKDAGAALVKKLFFSKPVESEVISFGYEEPQQVSIAQKPESTENISQSEQRGGAPEAPGKVPVNIEDGNAENAEEPQPPARPGHKGIDIVCDRGTPVRPVLSGVVIETGFTASYGNYVTIQHEDGYKSRYAHLESILTEAGEEVSTETQIGTVGSTGMSTGPHLHLEITCNGDPIDPSLYIYNSDAGTAAEN